MMIGKVGDPSVSQVRRCSERRHTCLQRLSCRGQKYDTWLVDDPRAALELGLTATPSCVPAAPKNGPHLHHDDVCVIKMGKRIFIQPRETRRRTLARLSVSIRLLLPTFGKPGTPTGTLCAVLGLYTLSSRSHAGAVPDARFVR